MNFFKLLNKMFSPIFNANHFFGLFVVILESNVVCKYNSRKKHNTEWVFWSENWIWNLILGLHVVVVTVFSFYVTQGGIMCQWVHSVVFSCMGLSVGCFSEIAILDS